MFLVTGDTHGDFRACAAFCDRLHTTLEDTLIILGDAGINYYEDYRDAMLKKILASLPITFFCIHGNHEARPECTGLYQQREWHGGKVFVETEYPNILFAKDAEIYELDGISAIVIGGAYSVDKEYRLARGMNWWNNEQPDAQTKTAVEQQLLSRGNKIDVVLSHTCPIRYEPKEVFIQGMDQRSIDKSTEEWLDEIEKRIAYEKWYCGHYHTDKRIDRMRFMFHEIDQLGR